MPTTSKLTGRERVRRAFAGEPVDRLPRSDQYWPETLVRWEREGLKGGRWGALEFLGNDILETANYWPSVYPGRREVIAEDGDTETIIDKNGAILKYWKNKSGTPEHIGWECDSPEKWEALHRPALVGQEFMVDLERVHEREERAKEAESWTCFVGVECFECCRATLGDVMFLMSLVEEPEWIEDMATVFTDNLLRNFDALWERGYRADGVWVYGDMAFNHATMCSPATYRDILWPQHKRLADWAHARGLPFIYHTDGDVRAVIPHYIEAGFDALQPLEAKANMDVRELCPTYKGKLNFFGNINMQTASGGDLEAIEEEMKTKLEAGKASGNYFYHSDHSVSPDVSWPVYQKMVEFLNRFGSYEE